MRCTRSRAMPARRSRSNIWSFRSRIPANQPLCRSERQGRTHETSNASADVVEFFASAGCHDGEQVKMSEDIRDKPDRIAPAKAPPDSPVLDEAGHAIIAMLQKASEASKEECARAMDMVHRLSFELRAAEERIRAAEAEAARFRDRATQAEAWLLRIREEIDQTLFQRKDTEPRSA